MKKYLFTLVTLAAALCACSDGAYEPAATSADITVELPADVDAARISDAALTFYNISSGETVTVACDTPEATKAPVCPGLYDISYTASYILENGITADVRGRAQGVTVMPGGAKEIGRAHV